MKKSVALSLLILICAFLGIADAWYLYESDATGMPLTCNIAGLDGCNIVAQSSYSHLFGVPLGLYGVFFYGLVFVLAAFATATFRRQIASALFALGIVGFLASLAFEAIQIFLIKAICIYCLGSAVLATLIFILAILLFRLASKPPPAPPPVLS